MFRRARNTPADPSEATRRAAAICDLLASEGVLDSSEAVEPLIVRHLSGESSFTEIIVDHPLAARWRLRPVSWGSRQLRLAYMGYFVNRDLVDKAEWISAKLAAL